MKIKILTSGSKANCTLIICDNTKILIDCGATASYIENELRKVDLTPKDINAIILTHTHSDHIKGLKVFIKKTDADVYIEEPLVREILKIVPPNQIKIIEKKFFIDNVQINTIKLSHDVDCYGLIINYKNKEMVYITDTGYLNQKYINNIKGKDVYVLESNYNIEMLNNGPYPYQLKNRIRSDYGHLSNIDCADILKQILTNRTKYVYLAHISENNNTYELAEKEVKSELKDFDFDLDKIKLTHQMLASEMIEI